MIHILLLLWESEDVCIYFICVCHLCPLLGSLGDISGYEEGIPVNLEGIWAGVPLKASEVTRRNLGVLGMQLG